MEGKNKGSSTLGITVTLFSFFKLVFSIKFCFDLSNVIVVNVILLFFFHFCFYYNLLKE